MEIARDELSTKLSRHDDLKLVMAASDFGFRMKHIPGSLNFRTANQMLAALGKDDDIVVYCSNADCHASLAAIQKLRDGGFARVRHYRGGIIDWEAAGLPLEGEWAGESAETATSPKSSSST